MRLIVQYNNINTIRLNIWKLSPHAMVSDILKYNAEINTRTNSFFVYSFIVIMTQLRLRTNNIKEI